jgi:hypothetical protein
MIQTTTIKTTTTIETEAIKTVTTVEMATMTRRRSRKGRFCPVPWSMMFRQILTPPGTFLGMKE